MGLLVQVWVKVVAQLGPSEWFVRRAGVWLLSSLRLFDIGVVKRVFADVNWGVIVFHRFYVTGTTFLLTSFFFSLARV